MIHISKNPKHKFKNQSNKKYLCRDIIINFTNHQKKLK